MCIRDRSTLNTKRLIGYLPEVPPLYPEMTVNEYLKFCIELKGVVAGDRQRHLHDIAALSGIENVLMRRIASLSHGYQQRVGLAQALAGNPPILLMDEPTKGLDPGQIVEFRRLIARLAEKHTILLSSHILSLVQSMCNRVLILHHGRLVADRCINTESPAFSLSLAASEKTALPMVRAIESVRRVQVIGAQREQTDLLVETSDPEHFPRRLFCLASARQIPILHLARQKDTLEEIYIHAIKEQEDTLS